MPRRVSASTCARHLPPTRPSPPVKLKPACLDASTPSSPRSGVCMRRHVFEGGCGVFSLLSQSLECKMLHILHDRRRRLPREFPGSVSTSQPPSIAYLFKFRVRPVLRQRSQKTGRTSPDVTARDALPPNLPYATIAAQRCDPPSGVR